MCMPHIPGTPAKAVLATPPTVAAMAAADGTRNDSSAILANKGRDSLRIDSTVAVPGATPGNGLNIGS